MANKFVTLTKVANKTPTIFFYKSVSIV